MKTKEKAKVEDLNYYETNGKKYYVDQKNVVLEYTKKEKEIALFLVSNLGGKIGMVPKVNYPKGTKTPDYMWNGEKWDLKEIKGCGKNVIDNALKDCKNQANNFIIDITKSNLILKDVERQIFKLFQNNKRRWIRKIIVIKNKNYYIHNNKKRN